MSPQRVLHNASVVEGFGVIRLQADRLGIVGEKFFHEVITNTVPLDMNILKNLKRSPLGLDLYLWLTYRTFGLTRPLRLTWPTLHYQTVKGALLLLPSPPRIAPTPAPSRGVVTPVSLRIRRRC